MLYYATGKRKNSIAKVRLVQGTGKITINNQDVKDYLPFDALILDLKQPLTLTKLEDKFDVIVSVQGGGFSGQTGAIRLGITRALEKTDAELRKTLKPAGFLTRDARIKERKKYGLKGARKAPQFSKR